MQNKLLSSLLLTISTLCGTTLYAQEQHIGRYHIDVSITPLSAVNIGPLQDVVGMSSHDSKLYIAGILRGTYQHTEKWSFSAGVGYAHQKVITTAPFSPESNQLSYSSNLAIWEIPLAARLNFLTHFYAFAGPILHIQQHANPHVDKQNGFGIHTGVGAKIPLSQSIAISLSPYYKMYSLVPFQSGRYYDRMQTVGVEIGVSYRLPKP